MFIFAERFNYFLTYKAINEFAGPVPDTVALIIIQIAFHFSKPVFCLLLLEPSQRVGRGLNNPSLTTSYMLCYFVLSQMSSSPHMHVSLGKDFRCLRGRFPCGRWGAEGQPLLTEPGAVSITGRQTPLFPRRDPLALSEAEPERIGGINWQDRKAK